MTSYYITSIFTLLVAYLSASRDTINDRKYKSIFHKLGPWWGKTWDWQEEPPFEGKQLLQWIYSPISDYWHLAKCLKAQIPILYFSWRMIWAILTRSAMVGLLKLQISINWPGRACGLQIFIRPLQIVHRHALDS